MDNPNPYLIHNARSTLGVGITSASIWTLALVNLFSRIVYAALLGDILKTFGTTANESPSHAFLVKAFAGAKLVGGLLIQLLAMKLTMSLHHDNSDDPSKKLIAFFLFGVGVELMVPLLRICTAVPGTNRRPSISNLRARQRSNSKETKAAHNKPCFLTNWSFCFFLLLAGSSCLLNYCVNNRRVDEYDYLGPMRLTRLPRLHYMTKVYPYSDEYDTQPCLQQVVEYNKTVLTKGLEQTNIQATVELGWGREWGCSKPADKERWNTNWPSISHCTSFICPPAFTFDIHMTCSCHSNEESARNATWECLEREFDLSRLKANETFDQDQPPWEDPTWPTMSRYGNCEGRVGFSTDPVYVQKIKRNGSRQLSFGVVCFVLWLIMFVKLWLRRRAQQWDNLSDSPSRTLWAYLYNIRNSAFRGDTVYIGQQQTLTPCPSTTGNEEELANEVQSLVGSRIEDAQSDSQP